MTEIALEEYDPNERLYDAMNEFVGCISGALKDICTVGWTIGEAYVPFDPDEDDDCDVDEAMCSQVWVRVTTLSPSAGSVESFEGDTCALSLNMGLEVGIIRCVDIPEDGDAPTATDVLAAAMQSMADMRAILCAALGCEVWDAIGVGTWSPTGPLGGEYGGIWTFDVELN
jgi:hypothetical protein